MTEDGFKEFGTLILQYECKILKKTYLDTLPSNAKAISLLWILSFVQCLIWDLSDLLSSRYPVVYFGLLQVGMVILNPTEPQADFLMALDPALL